MTIAVSNERAIAWLLMNRLSFAMLGAVLVCACGKKETSVPTPPPSAAPLSTVASAAPTGAPSMPPPSSPSASAPVAPPANTDELISRVIAYQRDMLPLLGEAKELGKRTGKDRVKIEKEVTSNVFLKQLGVASRNEQKKFGLSPQQIVDTTKLLKEYSAAAESPSGSDTDFEKRHGLATGAAMRAHRVEIDSLRKVLTSTERQLDCGRQPDAPGCDTNPPHGCDTRPEYTSCILKCGADVVACLIGTDGFGALICFAENVLCTSQCGDPC